MDGMQYFSCENCIFFEKKSLEDRTGVCSLSKKKAVDVKFDDNCKKFKESLSTVMVNEFNFQMSKND